MNIFQKNIDVLNRFAPLLSERVKDIWLPESIKFANGGIYVSNSKGREIFLGRQNINRGVKKITDYGNLKGSEVIVVYGFGLGGHILDIINSTPQSVFILVVESDIKLFRAALEIIDVEPIISCGKVSLSVGEDGISAVINRVEEHFGVFTSRDVKVIKYPQSIEINPPYYSEIDNRVKELLDLARINRATLERFASVWQGHIFNNLKSMLTRHGINGLFGKFKDKPAVIVSAGPSLDKNVKWLSMAEGKAIIIAVDTAVRTLLNNDIKPDFVLSLDPLVENYYHLEGLENQLKDSCLVANPVTYPEIIKRYKGDVLIMTCGDPLIQWFERFIDEKGETTVGGSVATSAFDFAFRLGGAPIILIGQDLSFYGGRAYTEGSYYNQRWIEEVNGGETLSIKHGNTILSETGAEVGDFFSGLVATSNKMAGWKRWFEIMIGKRKAKCINATEGGVNIEGSIEMPLSEAVNIWCKEDICAKDIVRGYIGKAKPADIHGLFNNMIKLSGEIKGLQKLSSEGAEISDGLVKLINMGEGKASYINKYLEKMSILATQMLDSKDFFDINRWGIDLLLDSVNLEMRHPSENAHSLLDTLKSYQTFFKGINEICSKFSRRLEKGIRELKAFGNMDKSIAKTEINNNQISIIK
jgi:hypothetical protein